MRRARKRKNNPHIPAHIDQAAIPAAVFFDHRGSGVWYTLSRDGTGKQKRKNIAGADATLSELHQIVGDKANIDLHSLRYLCEQFHESPQFKKLAPKTQSDYVYSRDVVIERPTKIGKSIGELDARGFTPTFIQRLIDLIAEEGTPSKAAHALRYLRRTMQWGRNRGYIDSNPASGIEAPTERKRRRLPNPTVMDALIKRARERGALTSGQRGACPPYLWYVMEIGYLCRLRGIETITLTDANELDTGVLTNRRKGSRDNIVQWTTRLRAAWEAAKNRRQSVWTAKAMPSPLLPGRRPIIVAAHGGRLQKSSLDTAWQRFITAAIQDNFIAEEDRFGLHDLKRRGITDTPGTRAVKQEASGHRDAAMMDVYDLSLPLVSPSAE